MNAGKIGSVEFGTRGERLLTPEPAEEAAERSSRTLSTSCRLLGGERLGVLTASWCRELSPRSPSARPACRAEPLEHQFPLFIAVLHLQVVSCEDKAQDEINPIYLL